MVKETTIPKEQYKSVVPPRVGLRIQLIHTRNSNQEERASSEFFNMKRSGDGDNQAEGSVPKRELSALVSNGQQILVDRGSGNKSHIVRTPSFCVCDVIPHDS
jgi:hypothetical protein